MTAGCSNGQNDGKRNCEIGYFHKRLLIDISCELLVLRIPIMNANIIVRNLVSYRFVDIESSFGRIDRFIIDCMSEMFTDTI